jgi:hypothetical protein
MDGSGRIKKLNSRVNVDLDCRILIWATANNDDKVKQALEGALFSRFAHALHCKRPTRELMYKIAEKRLEDWQNRGMTVQMEWAKIVTDFAFDKLKTTDTRKILALLDGRDELATGYLEDVEKTFTA